MITARGRKLARSATNDLNSSVYEQIGLSEDQRRQLIELLAELRASGHEFDVERSKEVIEELDERHSSTRRTTVRPRDKAV